MKLLLSFLKLVRWQNLFFIILTQVLFYFCIYQSLYTTSGSMRSFLLIVLASVTIAAAGYIINDYFDLNIDQINKPHKNVINTIISRRWAIIWHLVLSGIGLMATVMAVSVQKWYLVVANLLCVILLWFYSTSLKRRVIIGNVVISLLTAWTVLIVFFSTVSFREAFVIHDATTSRYFRLSFLYGGFAFIISIIREAIKDVQDMDGDTRYGCETLPIVAGITATKIYLSVWIVVLIAALVVLQLYTLRFGWWWADMYSVLFIIAPLFYLLSCLYKATSVLHFSRLSSLAKLIMLTGILSMIFFRVYF